MSEARAKQPPGLPWSVRLYESAPFAPVWVGVLIGVAWLSIYAVFAIRVGWVHDVVSLDRPFWETNNLVLSGMFALMFGYMPTSTAYAFRGTVQELRALRPVMDCSDSEFDERIERLTLVDKGALRFASAVAIVLGLATPFLPIMWRTGQTPALGDPELMLNMAHLTILYWLGARTWVLGSGLGRRFSSIAASGVRVELLDPSRLAPIGRVGLRGARSALGGTAMASLILLLPLIGYYVPLSLVVGAIGLSLGLALYSLLAPMRGVHRRMEEAKQAELQRVLQSEPSPAPGCPC